MFYMLAQPFSLSALNVHVHPYERVIECDDKYFMYTLTIDIETAKAQQKQEQKTQSAEKIQTEAAFSSLLLENLCNTLPRNDAILLFISLDAKEAVAKVAAPHVPQKVLVVGNDNELEIALRLPCLDNAM